MSNFEEFYRSINALTTAAEKLMDKNIEMMERFFEKTGEKRAKSQTRGKKKKTN